MTAVINKSGAFLYRGSASDIAKAIDNTPTIPKAGLLGWLFNDDSLPTLICNVLGIVEVVVDTGAGYVIYASELFSDSYEHNIASGGKT